MTPDAQLTTQTLDREQARLIFSSASVIHHNLSVPALLEQAIQRGEGQLASNGALVAYTGQRTGRSPKDRFIVRNAVTEQKVDWGTTNQPIAQSVYDALRQKVLDYLQERELFVLDARAGAHAGHTLRVRVVTEYAWHNLFARQLFIRLDADEIADFAPDWTVISAPGFKVDAQQDGVKSEAAIMLDFERQEILICGTEYAGEIKKAIFSVLNFILPQRNVLSMHCAANCDEKGKVALFFGLSGTGKTSLSSDPARQLIGDDEHGWREDGIFNFEGGCYAKCIRLSAEQEPQIYQAVRFGSVIENVAIEPLTRVPNYNSECFTENTRVAYPLDYIPNSVVGGAKGHAEVIFFLTADAFGVLPPIALLDSEQALYYFLSGYTAKLAGTEVGITDPQATFEACFGAPFLPLPATDYARLLREKIERHQTRVYLLNTGWSGGSYGVGQRISIAHTRAMVAAALTGELETTATYTDPVFKLRVPTHIAYVPSAILRPRETWRNQAEYDRLARVLVGKFVENFNTKFAAAMPELVQAGPR
jgi:phosphoenolpyruvate carboxykinase (ATP)